MTEEHDPKSSARETVQPPLEIPRSLPGDPAAVGSPDLMGYPFFSLGESRRHAAIRYRSAGVEITVEGTSEHGIATIWDADILIWAASQVLEAKRRRTGTSRLLAASLSEILQFMGRDISTHNHDQLRAAFDRLQSTTIATTMRQLEGRRRHRFSWLGEWKEHINSQGRPSRISLTLPDWLYLGLLDSTLTLNTDSVYFTIKGGIERWLYRLVRFAESRVGQFELLHLYARSGALLWPADFARHLKRIATAQALPGFQLGVIRGASGREILTFAPCELTVPPKVNAPASTPPPTDRA
jgi:plasmid replication initiation protein